jgi:hypothetical protein
MNNIYNMEFGAESNEALELPNLEQLQADLELTRDCCGANNYDNVQIFAVACIMNMAANVLETFKTENPKQLWSRITSDMRWLASWAINTYPDELPTEVSEVLQAIYNVKGCALLEAMALYEAEVAGSTARLQ